MIVRARVETDDPFIFDSWLRSFRSSHESGPYAPDLYFPTARETVTRLLARPSVAVLVLEDTLPDVGETILSWLVHEPGWQRWSKRQRRLEQFHVVHYAFTREGARNKGRAAHLLELAGVNRAATSLAFSFATGASRGLLGERAKFLPDAARYESRKETST